jgi:cytochrome c-type biogenesis protein CcmI
MSAGIQVALLAVTVLTAVWLVAIPILRPSAAAGEQPALAAREEERARLFAALEELGRDRKSGMISQADYEPAVGEIRSRLARL